MPIYLYCCPKCGWIKQIEQNIKDDALTEEPCGDKTCDGTLQRQIAGGTTFILGGRGWADDGYS